MHSRTLLCLVLSLAAPSLSAQNTPENEVLQQAQNPGEDAQAVRLATANYIREFIAGGKWFPNYQRASVRMLAPWALPKAIHGDDVLEMTLNSGSIQRSFRLISKPLPARSAAEDSAMAEAMKAKVATSADSIYCDAKGCHGVLGLLIQIGNPVISGGKASIVFGLLTRTESDLNKLGLPGRLNSFALWLDKTDQGWTPNAIAIANQGKVGDRRKASDPGTPGAKGQTN